MSSSGKLCIQTVDQLSVPTHARERERQNCTQSPRHISRFAASFHARAPTYTRARTLTRPRFFPRLRRSPPTFFTRPCVFRQSAARRPGIFLFICIYALPAISRATKANRPNCNAAEGNKPGAGPPSGGGFSSASAKTLPSALFEPVVLPPDRHVGPQADVTLPEQHV